MVVELLDDHPSFVLGFEVGRLYTQMRDGAERTIEGMYHAANDEQILLMARRLGWSAEIERLADGWIGATFTR